MDSFFTIIIPVYNVAPYIEQCVGSVVQAIKRLMSCSDMMHVSVEILCVNDGSSDGSGSVLDEVARRVVAEGFTVKVFHQMNAGVSAARNCGLREAKGDWILFLDGDDVWHPDLLLDCARLIADHPDAQIIRFEMMQFIDGVPIVWGDSAESEKVSVRNLVPGLTGDDMRLSFACNCCHRSIIPDYGFKGYVRGEDLLFRAECLLAAKQMVTTTRCFYGYRTRAGSAMQSPIDKRKLLDRIGYSLDWLQILEKKPVDSSIYHCIAKNLTESYVCDLLSTDVTNREDLWKEWYEMLPVLLKHKGVRGWYRFVALLCLKIRLRIVALLLCACIAEIKRLKRRIAHING